MATAVCARLGSPVAVVLVPMGYTIFASDCHQTVKGIRFPPC